MKTSREKEIEEIASNVLSKYVKRGGCYKVFQEIMKAESIKYREIQNQNISFLGALTTGNNGQVYIMINSSTENIGRKNFTIAHELGHFFLLHQLKQNSFYCSDKSIVEEGTYKDPIEQEANYFASCLLMPETKVKNAFLSILANSRKAKDKNHIIVNNYTYGIWKVIKDTLTKRYGVSEAALRYRLKQHNLVSFEFNTN